jgi:hypothetical protein
MGGLPVRDVGGWQLGKRCGGTGEGRKEGGWRGEKWRKGEREHLLILLRLNSHEKGGGKRKLRACVSIEKASARRTRHVTSPGEEGERRCNDTASNNC